MIRRFVYTKYHYVTPPPTYSIVSIGAGQYFSYALKTDGTYYTWGLNTAGQLGDGTVTGRCKPISIVGKTFCKVANNMPLSITARANDYINRTWAWGGNTNAQIGNNQSGAANNKCSPVLMVGASKTFCSISGGASHGLAIDNRGRAWNWGSNTAGVVSNADGTLTCTPKAVLGVLKTFCKITSGSSTNFGIDNRGQIWGWGTNSTGQLGVGNISAYCTPKAIGGTLKTFCQIAAGNNHGLAIDIYGKTWSWGVNNVGQLGSGTSSISTPVAVLGRKTFCQVITGQNHSVAIDLRGQCWAWGGNTNGCLGDFSSTQRNSPVQVYGSHTFCQIAAAVTTTYGLDNNKVLWAWGTNTGGQCGDGTTTNHCTPVAVWTF